MKIFTLPTLLILGLTGCTSAKYQQMQNERGTRREAREYPLFV